jgi:hypothetical protein
MENTLMLNTDCSALLSQFNSLLEDDCRQFATLAAELPEKFNDNLTHTIEFKNACNNLELKITEFSDAIKKSRYEQIMEDIHNNKTIVDYSSTINTINSCFRHIISIMKNKILCHFGLEMKNYYDDFNNLFCCKNVDQFYGLETLIDRINVYKLYHIYCKPADKHELKTSFQQIKNDILDFVLKNLTNPQVKMLHNLITGNLDNYESMSILKDTIFTIPIMDNIIIKIVNLLLILKINPTNLFKNMFTFKNIDRFLTLIEHITDFCKTHETIQKCGGSDLPFESLRPRNPYNDTLAHEDIPDNTPGNVPDNQCSKSALFYDPDLNPLDLSDIDTCDNKKFIFQNHDNNIKDLSCLLMNVITFFELQDMIKNYKELFTMLHKNYYIKTITQYYCIVIYLRNLKWFYEYDFSQLGNSVYKTELAGVDFTNFFVNFKYLKIKEVIILYNKVIKSKINNEQLCEMIEFELYLLDKEKEIYVDFIKSCSCIFYIILVVLFYELNSTP